MHDRAPPCCTDLPDLLELDAALERMKAIEWKSGRPETSTLADGLGRITAGEIRAPLSLPAFDNSAVDGYAFRHADCVQAGTPLKIVGTSLAGIPFDGTMPPSSAVRIATGAMVPSDADTIVMQENCTITDSILSLDQIPPKGAYIRRQGADIKKGERVFGSGHRLMPQDIALIGGLGLKEIAVQPILRIAIASTGTELDTAGEKLKPGQIIDTNSLMLKHLLAHLPVKTTIAAIMPDSKGETVAALRALAADHDMVITTGGVSVGSHDYVRDALHMLGQVHFWRLAIRPGRPVLLGQVGNCLMAGLPGNPVSAMVTFFLIVRPVLNLFWGSGTALTPGFSVPLAADVEKESKLRSFPRARLEMHEGEWRASLYADQSSNLISSLVKTDGLLDLPSGQTAFKAGTTVVFRPFTGLLD